MGIGGIIIVPILVQIGGLSPQAAIPIALAGYIPTGALGILTHVRKGTLAFSSARQLCLGAMPAAMLGSLAVDYVSASMLMLLMAAMAMLSGSFGLLRTSGEGDNGAAKKAEFSSMKLLGIGSATGLLSSLTGTGGPAVLLPILLFLEVPTVMALGLAQASQLPIAGVATAVGLARGQVDVTQSLMLASGLAAGSYAGGQLSYRLNATALRRLVSLALFLGGVAIAAKELPRPF